MIVYDQEKRYFFSTKINDSHFFAGFGTKYLSDSADNHDLQDFLKEHQFSVKRVFLPLQKHTTIIHTLSDEFSPRKIGDGSITPLKEMALAARTADCVPIVFVDKKKGIIGISHQGWKGTYDAMQQKMIEKLVSCGANKEDIIVAIGPSIGMCCYEIKNDVYKLFYKRYKQYEKSIFQKRGGKMYLNLLQLNYLLLKEQGLADDQIDYFPFCTYCDQDRFFSYRRDKHLEGEMINFIIQR
jgi:YfiH family protein